MCLRVHFAIISNMFPVGSLSAFDAIGHLLVPFVFVFVLLVSTVCRLTRLSSGVGCVREASVLYISSKIQLVFRLSRLIVWLVG